jgi:hypothetical protein
VVTPAVDVSLPTPRSGQSLSDEPVEEADGGSDLGPVSDEHVADVVGRLSARIGIERFV